MESRTKIICTIGPAVANKEMILRLIDAGMNVARLNFSHGTHEEHGRVIQILKEARQERNMPLAIMLDNKGPEIRLGEIAGKEISVSAGQEVTLTSKNVLGTANTWSVHPQQALSFMQVGMKVLFDDGYLSAEVIAKQGDDVLIRVLNSGKIKSHKSMNLPGAEIDLPVMTEQDKQDLYFGCQMDVDVIAASFIRSKEQIQDIRQLLLEYGKPDILVLAKIENHQGVRQFDEILHASDGIMVARGDLGVEMPLKEIPALQKMMVKKCLEAGKIVITATQMLESMIQNPRPTRAEVSDVANAIYDSSSAVMLSGESAMGKYPIEAVLMMKGIIEATEKHFPYQEFFAREQVHSSPDISASIAQSSVNAAYSSKAKAIFVFTSSGHAARMVSRYRPEMPIIALTPNRKTYHQMALYWGTIAVDPTESTNLLEATKTVSHFAQQKHYVQLGDLVIVTAGNPFGISGTTNMIIVESIGDVILRAKPGHGQTVQGKVALIPSSDPKLWPASDGKIIVITTCDERYSLLVQKARGVILQNSEEDDRAEQNLKQIAEKQNLAYITQAQSAFKLLKEGQPISLDPEKGLVYRKL